MFGWLFGKSSFESESKSYTSSKTSKSTYVPEYERDKKFDPSNEWPFNEPLSGSSSDFDSCSGYDPCPYDDGL